MKVFILFVGKERDAHANAIARDFVDRSRRFAHVEMREIRPDRFDPFERHPTARIVALDPAGRLLDSPQVIRLVEDAEREARDLVFLLGGHDGLPVEWRRRAALLWSLTPLTFPHELARVCLAEQIYRAFATLRGHPYPR